jgi:O-antigen/teichoic acid export membrane protein
MTYALVQKAFLDKLRASPRPRWAILDQAVLSVSNLLMSIVLVRALGMHEFGIYSLVLIGLQLPSALQLAGILSPMMSSFDQLAVTRFSYLATILLHQALFLLTILAILLILVQFSEFTEIFFPVSLPIAVGLLLSTQFQELARRFLFVTERPRTAFLSGMATSAIRLALITALAATGELSLERVWVVVIFTGLVAIVPLLPDVSALEKSWDSIYRISSHHARISGWMIGNAAAQWFSASLFFLLIGTVLGPAQLGGVRAVQNLIAAVNPFLLALENFVPSAATKIFKQGGPVALRQYVIRLSIVGFAGIASVTAFLLLLEKPLMILLYGHTIDQQLAILAILGTCVALSPIDSAIMAALRTLGLMKAAFWGQMLLGLLSVVLGWYFAKVLGVLGGLSALLLVRALATGQYAFALQRAFHKSDPRVDGARDPIND